MWIALRQVHHSMRTIFPKFLTLPASQECLNRQEYGMKWGGMDSWAHATGFQQCRISEGNNRQFAKLNRLWNSQWSFWPMKGVMIFESKCLLQGWFLHPETGSLTFINCLYQLRHRLCVLNEETCLSEQIGNYIKAVRLIWVLIYLYHILGAKIKQACTSLKMAAEWKVWEAKYISPKLCFTVPVENNIQSVWLFCYNLYRQNLEQNNSESELQQQLCQELLYRDKTADKECKAGWRLIWGKMKEIMTAFPEEEANKKAFYDL